MLLKGRTGQDPEPNTQQGCWIWPADHLWQSAVTWPFQKWLRERRVLTTTLNEEDVTTSQATHCSINRLWKVTYNSFRESSVWLEFLYCPLGKKNIFAGWPERVTTPVAGLCWQTLPMQYPILIQRTNDVPCFDSKRVNTPSAEFLQKLLYYTLSWFK